jgi:hypothetical protein
MTQHLWRSFGAIEARRSHGVSDRDRHERFFGIDQGVGPALKTRCLMGGGPKVGLEPSVSVLAEANVVAACQCKPASDSC